MEREVRERTNAEGYTLHHGSIVTLSAQPLVPSLDGQANARHLPRFIEVFTVSVVPAWAAARSALPDRLELARDAASSWPAVARIARRKGDWGQVVLPAREAPVYVLAAFVAVRWESSAAGWVRLEAPGPFAGTRTIRWTIHRRGAWP